MGNNNYQREAYFYKKIFLESKIPRLLIDSRNGKIIDANKAASSLFGTEIEKLKNISITDILHLDSQRLLLELIKILAGEKDFFILKPITNQFKEDFFDVYPYKFVWEDTIIVCLDFHESKKATSGFKNFMHSEDAYRFLLEETTDMIFIADLSGKLYDANLKAVECLAFNSRDELLGKNIFTEIFKDQNDSRNIIMEIKTKGYSYSKEITIKDNNNNEKTLSMRAKLFTPISFYDLSEDMLLIIAKCKQDIIPPESPVKAYTLRMEALEHISKGISHEFNNVFTGIIGFGELLNLHLANDPVAKAYVEKILFSANRGSKLVQDLSLFAQTAPCNPVLININDIILQFEKFIGEVMNHSIKLELNLSSENLMTMVDPTHIKIMLLNLFNNAKDAMPSGGTITISTSFAEIDQKFKNTYGFGEAGIYVLLSFTDSGVGIDESLKDKIFLPFFTTKGIGRGTGLGLSIVYSIVKKHNGYIILDSEKDHTTFKIFLPYLGNVVERSDLKKFGEPPIKDEAILVVEEDEIVASLIRDILEGFKYKVIVTKKADEAIRISKENIKLAIINPAICLEDGNKLYDVLRSINPSIKFIFLNSNNESTLFAKHDELKEVIKKPYSATKILTQVEKALKA